MRDRFTPAHAGNTPDCRGRHLRIEVHPRSRGEYRISVAACFQSSGSPPLTRGIRSFSNPLFQVARFTPAHAGNTSVQLSKLICNQVHPRSRGEYSNVSGVSIPNSGSPPLTRGILVDEPSTYLYGRFTPAHAGNTPYFDSLYAFYKVHPRSRGEYQIGNAQNVTAVGSPPLTRGIQLPLTYMFSYARFTPAHAGNTKNSEHRQPPDEVHPRSRGEY